MSSSLAQPVAPPRRWWVRPLIALACVGVGVIVVRLVGRVDWGQVGLALRHLQWWHPVVLVGLVLVRQVVNAYPLSLYIKGVTPWQATMNDQVAILTSTIAPPPSDLALRTAMFSSWGVPVAKGLAGTVMNTLTFYIVRFSAPAAGFVLLALTGTRPGLRWADLVSIAVAITILVGVLLIIRSEALAQVVGVRAGRVAHRVRHSVDPQRWAQACMQFRIDIEERFQRGFPRAIAAMCVLLALDLTILTVCLRFVGVTPDEFALVQIAIAFLFAYPFTFFPFQGIGIVDALIVAAAVQSGGLVLEAPVLAGLAVWRVFAVGGPLLLGVGCLAAWRRGVASRR